MKLLSLLIASACAEGAATATDLAASMSAMPLFSKGLTVTAMGLGGVFLVLLLFFMTIKLMQKLGK